LMRLKITLKRSIPQQEDILSPATPMWTLPAVATEADHRGALRRLRR
jgi:hypothetical protein